MPQENKDWKEEWNKFARADFKNARNELIDNPELTESSDAYFGYMVRKENELFRVVDFGNIKTFIQSVLDKQREEITDKLHTLHANFKVEWLNNDYLEPDFDASAKKEILNAKMGLIELILTEIKKSY